MLSPDDRDRVAEHFDVDERQVLRDHLISHVLAALSRQLADDLLFFGGTALARGWLHDGRLSEDIDLIALGRRADIAGRIPPAPGLFQRPPAEEEWRRDLAHQTRLTLSASEALVTVRDAWAAAAG